MLFFLIEVSFSSFLTNDNHVARTTRSRETSSLGDFTERVFLVVVQKKHRCLPCSTISSSSFSCFAPHSSLGTFFSCMFLSCLLLPSLASHHMLWPESRGKDTCCCSEVEPSNDDPVVGLFSSLISFTNTNFDEKSMKKTETETYWKVSHRNIFCNPLLFFLLPRS